MKRKLYRDSSFFILLILSLANIGYYILYPQNVLVIRHLLLLIIIFLLLVIYLFNRRIYLYLFTLLLIIGCFNLLYLTNPDCTIDFGFNISDHEFRTINIQWIAVLLLLIQILLNHKQYGKWLKNFFK